MFQLKLQLIWDSNILYLLSFQITLFWPFVCFVVFKLIMDQLYLCPFPLYINFAHGKTLREVELGVGSAQMFNLLRCVLLPLEIAMRVPIEGCRHTFCRKCIVKFIESSLTCPECRQPIEDKRMGLDMIANNIIN